MATTRAAQAVPWGTFAFAAAALTGVSIVGAVVEAGSLRTMLAAGGFAALTLVLSACFVVQRRARDAKLTADLALVAGRLLRLERREGERAQPSGLAADIAQLSRLVSDLAETVGRQERTIEALRLAAAAPPAPALPAPAVPTPSPPETPRVRPAPSRDDFARAAAAIMRRFPAEPASSQGVEEALLQDLEAGRLATHLQPVVTLPQRRARLYQASSYFAGAGSDLFDQSSLRAKVEAANRLPELDALELGRVLAVVRHLASRDLALPVAFRLSPLSLVDTDFAAAAEQKLAADAGLAARVLAVLPAAELAWLTPLGRSTLERLVERGLQIVLDGLPDVRTDWADLARRGVAFVRVDAETLLDPGRRLHVPELIGSAAAEGIGLIAGAVDGEQTIPDLIELDVALAQGSALGPPRPVHAEALEPPPAAATPVPEVSAADRLPFREFLRRAG